MTSKRTFGLVGDYGSDSEGDNDGDSQEEVGGVHGYLVEKAPKLNDIKSHIQPNEPTPNQASVKQPWSKWHGVSKEYEDSSLMYRFTQDLDEDYQDSKSEKKPPEPKINDEKSANIPVSDALAVPTLPVEQNEQFKHMVAEHQKRDQEKKDMEQVGTIVIEQLIVKCFRLL